MSALFFPDSGSRNLPAGSSKSNSIDIKIAPKPVIPNCTIKLTQAPGKKSYSSYNGYPANQGDNHTYKFKVERTDDPSLDFPAGTTFEWVIKSGTSDTSWVIGSTSTYGPYTTPSLTLSTGSFGSGNDAVTYGVNGGRSRGLWCTIKMPGADDLIETYSITFVKGY